MWKSIVSGARTATVAGVAGALALVLIDLGLITDRLLASFQSIWFGVPYFFLESGTAFVATLPFSILGGAVLGYVSNRRNLKLSVALGVGSLVGVMAVLGAFMLVFGLNVCLWSHGHCYEDPIGWLTYVGQREFAEGYIYPARLALSVTMAAILGALVSIRVWTSGSGRPARQASA